MYGIDQMTFKVIMLRAALARKKDYETYVKSCKLLKENLSDNDINVLGDSLTIIKVKAGEAVINEDEDNEEE